MEKNRNFFARIWYKFPVFWNLLLIIAFLLLFGLSIPYFLDLWTHHGQVSKVPNIVGKSLGEAVKQLEAANLDVVVVDSVYRQDLAPGTVTDAMPSVNSVVKKGRPVYLTIKAFSPEKVTIDMILTDISYKQAEAYLKARGLQVERRFVPSLYPDLVVSVKSNGRSLGLGSKVSVEDLIVLEVGNAPESTGDLNMDMAIQAALEAKEQESEGSDDYDVVESLIKEKPTENTSTSTTSPEIIQLIKNKFGRKNQ